MLSTLACSCSLLVADACLGFSGGTEIVYFLFSTRVKFGGCLLLVRHNLTAHILLRWRPDVKARSEPVTLLIVLLTCWKVPLSNLPQSTLISLTLGATKPTLDAPPLNFKSNALYAVPASLQVGAKYFHFDACLCEAFYNFGISLTLSCSPFRNLTLKFVRVSNLGTLILFMQEGYM